MKIIKTALVFIFILITAVLFVTSVEAYGCVLGTGGAPGCANVVSWGSSSIKSDVLKKAQNNPGNACDEDKDGDGWPACLPGEIGLCDCDDWNPNVHPGMTEIPNNGIDDDCNPDTPDKGTYTPRQALYVSLKYDETLIFPGKEFNVLVDVTNNYEEKLEDVQVIVSIPGLLETRTQKIAKINSGETVTKSFNLEIPNNLNKKFEQLRISVSNDKYKRIIYRELLMQ